ncbi:MAG TPA: hypothetical protein PLA94_32375, partial [Myxococcota bacterium]|nr:hypothetical protein [Myxococcota bacterium]
GFGGQPSVKLRRFFLDAPGNRALINEFETTVLGSPPATGSLSAWNDADLRQALLMFHTLSLAHELADATAYQMGSADYEDLWQLEQRGRKVEAAVLKAMVESGKWTEADGQLYRRFLMEMRNGLPRVDIPADVGQARELFNRGYDPGYGYSAGDSEWMTAMAMSLDEGVAQLAAPAALSTLHPLYLPSPTRVRDYARLQIAELARDYSQLENARVGENGSQFVVGLDAELRAELEIDESTGLFRARLRHSMQRSAAQEQALLDFANGFYRAESGSGDWRMSVLSDGVIWSTGWLGLDAMGRPRNIYDTFASLKSYHDRYYPVCVKVNSGLLSAEDARTVVKE